MDEDMEKQVRLTYRMVGDKWVLEDAYQSDVKFDSYFGRKKDIGLPLNHINYLKSIFVKHLDDTDMDESVYEWFDDSLADYVSRLSSTKGLIHTFFDHFDTSKEYEFIIPEIIEIIRSMISFVVYLHLKEVTFDSNCKLNYTNHFGVSDGILKFWRVEFKESTSHVDRRNDFNMISRIIKNDLLGELEFESLPVCMVDLITRMNSNSYPERTDTWLHKFKRYVTVTTEDFFPMHIALFSHSQRVSYMKNCIDMFNGLNTRDRVAYNEAIFAMGDNNCWLNYSGTGFLYILISLLYQCMKRENPKVRLDHLPNAEIMEKYFMQLGDVYKDDSDKFLTNLNIVRMVRNLATHLYDTMRAMTDWENGAFITIDDLWIDATIMDLFEEKLLVFQREMFWLTS